MNEEDIVRKLMEKNMAESANLQRWLRNGQGLMLQGAYLSKMY